MWGWSLTAAAGLRRRQDELVGGRAVQATASPTSSGRKRRRGGADSRLDRIKRARSGRSRSARVKSEKVKSESAEPNGDGGGVDPMEAVEEEADEITYKPYRPSKLRYGPDVTYKLALPADIVSEGRLSDLQLEAIVYGCQRHEVDLPVARDPIWRTEGGAKDEEGEADGGPRRRSRVPLRAGFLLGDGAGMGKGRTLAGFCVENIARGRDRHVWVRVWCAALLLFCHWLFRGARTYTN